MQEIAASDREEFRNWDSLHAALANTSPAVLQKNYNRWNNSERPVRTLEIINDNLKLKPSSGIATTIDNHATGLTYLADKPGTITKVEDERYEERVHQYLCMLEDGEKKWLPSFTLDPYEDLVLEYFETCSKKETADKAVAGEDDDVPDLDSDSHDSSSEESDVEVDEDRTTIAEVVNNSNKPSRKRKRPTVYDVEEVLLDNRALKPGDVVSVNPADSSDEFWLAQVLNVVNKDQIKIQWLERKGKSHRYRLGKVDEVEVITMNGYAGGEWLSPKCYYVE